MSMNHNHQMLPYFNRKDVSHAMIKILEEQRISNEDLRTIDRDDIEHLFKNSSGFTFRDRKQFWNAIQKIRLPDTKNDVICIEEENDEVHDNYDINDKQRSNYRLNQRYIPIATSNPPKSMGIFNPLNIKTQENLLELSSSEEESDSAQMATTSLPLPVILPQQLEPPNIEFLFPVQLPPFSSRVITAFNTNNIEREWTTLVNELASWIFTKKQTTITKGEYQAIGRTVFQHYPSIAKDGFRPWSRLCRCITQRLSKLKKRSRRTKQ